MKIVLATDGSKFSEAAAQAVITQGRPDSTEIQVLHVVEPSSLLVTREMGGYDRALDAVWEAETKQAQALVTKVADVLRSKGLKVTTKLLLGSVSEAVVRHAGCSVEIARIP